MTALDETGARRLTSRIQLAAKADPVAFRELFEWMTWEEIKAKRGDAIRQARAYTENAALCDRYLALADLAPKASNPHEAATLLNLNLDDFLRRDPDAA